jgi:probable FeS assembly SUF system protein SufT
MNEPIALSRACEALEIPSGLRHILPMGTVVRISQALGDSITITAEQGNRYRVGAGDADALGLAVNSNAVNPDREASAAQPGTVGEEVVLAELRTIFDPEIPVNIVDLGLIYSCTITPLPESGNRIEIKMTLTAPGCGMAGVLKEDVERRLSRLPGVKEVSVEVVFDPPWEPNRMSDAAKLQLGLDLDFSPPPSALPIWRPGR